VGPYDATFIEKMQIIKTGVKQVVRVINFTIPNRPGNRAGETIQCEKFLYEIAECHTTDACGLPIRQGVARRPQLKQFPNLALALGTLACYAKDTPDGLHTKIPRIGWCPAMWKSAPIADLMARIAAKRAGRDYPMLDLAPRNTYIVEDMKKQETKAATTGLQTTEVSTDTATTPATPTAAPTTTAATTTTVAGSHASTKRHMGPNRRSPKRVLIDAGK
jgi:hypothetical protein